MKLTPTQLTLRELRKREHAAVAIVEHWNSFARIRQDLFGIIDVLCVSDTGTLAVQCTTDSNVSARVKKISKSPVLPILLTAGWEIEVWGWKKVEGQWLLRVVPVKLNHWVLK